MWLVQHPPQCDFISKPPVYSDLLYWHSEKLPLSNAIWRTSPSLFICTAYACADNIAIRSGFHMATLLGMGMMAMPEIK